MNLIEEFLKQFDHNSNYVLSSITSDANKKIFVQRCYDVVNQASKQEDVRLARIIIINYAKMAQHRKNGWLSCEKDMSLLAYRTALDVLDSLIRKNTH